MKSRNLDKLLEAIQNNIGNRKLVLRWKNEEVEKEIFKKLGIKAEFYVSRSRERIDNISTFSDEILNGKAKKYYLVILYGLRWNSFRGRSQAIS